MKISIGKYFYAAHYLMHIVFFACRKLNVFWFKKWKLGKTLAFDDEQKRTENKRVY